MKKIRLLPLAMTLLTANVAFAADEIHWTVTGPDSVTFDWRGTTSEKTIGYGQTSGVYTQVTATAPSPLPVSSSGPFWEAKLTGLAANTRYYYKIGTLPERSFRTPPAPGSSDFNVYTQGNIGSSTTYFNTGTIQGMIANDLPAFVVGLGDLTLGNTNGKATVDQHFNDVMVWSKEAAYMPVWGDMETKVSTAKNAKDHFKNYKGRFAVPNPQTSPGSPLAGGEDWYWFDYGNVRFITMPEPWSGAWTDWNTKAATLMAQAQADANIKFIVTFVHQPAYSSGQTTGSATLKGMLDALGDTYSKYKLNVNAQSNNYERSLPQHGVIHVTAGTGGANLTPYGTAQPAWSAFRAMHLGALKLHFTDNGIEGSFICGPAGGGTNDVTCTEGSIIDSFAIGNPYNFPPAACAPAPASPLVVNAKNMGAKGDGVTNDTAAIQAAIDQVGGTGGTVLVPDGTYMIDAVTRLMLQSNMTFRMTEGAVLKAITNNYEKYGIIRIKNASNVNVVGGTVQGERADHQGTTGQWGMGIEIFGSSTVVIEGVTAKDNWGDGFYIGDLTTNSTFCSVIADNNRRQGMSIVFADGIVVKDSIFKNTNGTPPMAGLDIEPNAGETVNNVQILNSQFLNNKTYGILLLHSTTTNVTVDGNTVANNGDGINPYPGINVQGASELRITNNSIKDNFEGIYFWREAASNNFVSGNTIINNVSNVSNKSTGIWLDALATGHTINNNTLLGWIYHIWDDGIGNTITGNNAV